MKEEIIKYLQDDVDSIVLDLQNANDPSYWDGGRCMPELVKARKKEKLKKLNNYIEYLKNDLFKNKGLELSINGQPIQEQ